MASNQTCSAAAFCKVELCPGTLSIDFNEDAVTREAYRAPEARNGITASMVLRCANHNPVEAELSMGTVVASARKGLCAGCRTSRRSSS